MSELISEPITPLAGTFDTARMGCGEPGLPTGFVWRDETLTIVENLDSWKKSSREGGTGELYLRRHYYKLRMSDGATWTIYFVRQAPKTGNRKQRWFLYTIDADGGGGDVPGRRRSAVGRRASSDNPGDETVSIFESLPGRTGGGGIRTHG